MEVYTQENGQPVPSAISALYTKSSSCPLLATSMPETKVLAHRDLSVHSAFCNAWAWLDDVLVKLKPDNFPWAAVVVHPLQQLCRAENVCDHSTQQHSGPSPHCDWLLGCSQWSRLQTDRLKTPLGEGLWIVAKLLIRSSEAHALMRPPGVKLRSKSPSPDDHHRCSRNCSTDCGSMASIIKQALRRPEYSAVWVQDHWEKGARMKSMLKVGLILLAGAVE